MATPVISGGAAQVVYNFEWTVNFKKYQSLDRTRIHEAITHQLLFETSPDWAFSWAAVYRDTDQKNTDGTNTDIEWFSTGVRPIYYLTDHLNIAFELGYDHVDNNQTNQSGGLTKATVALQIAKSRGFFSRPVVRVFGTFATWDSDFKGAVGGTTYANETNGHTFGVQAEWWW